MSMWVHVWRWMARTARGVPMVTLVASTSGCIDDFDDPKGYGGTSDDRRVSTRGGCFELCERTVSCGGVDELGCKRNCADYETAIERSGCEEPYAGLLDCALELDDICDAPDVCVAEAERLVMCAGY